MASHSKPWGGPHPGCMIILLDQSGSMEDTFGGEQWGADKRKRDVVATLLNNLLQEIIKTNTSGGIVKDRAEIAVLGYSGVGVANTLPGQLGQIKFPTLSQLNDNPLRIDMRVRKEMDDTGNMIEVPVYFPVWVDPVATGGTPMVAALEQARELADRWAADHPDNYPPVIINVTDGMATDGKSEDITRAVDAVRQVRTSDGEALVYNCHITDKNLAAVEYPSSLSELPNDPFAQVLFSTASEVPEAARNQIESATGRVLPAGARGMIFNGDAQSVKEMFAFASVALLVDPNR